MRVLGAAAEVLLDEAHDLFSAEPAALDSASVGQEATQDRAQILAQPACERELEAALGPIDDVMG